MADIEAAKAKVLRAGSVLEQDVYAYAWGHIAIFSDPFGNGFCFIEFLNRGYDEITV